MLKVVNRAVLVMLSVSAVGCASITGSSNQSVSVQAREQTGKEVAGAACELTNNKGTWFVTTPGSVSIHRSNDDLQATCRKEGLENGRAAIVSETKGSMFGNIIFGGGIGAIIDHNNGTAYEYPTLIQIVMGAFSKIEVPKPNPDQQNAPATGASQVSGLQPVAASQTQSQSAATLQPAIGSASQPRPSKEERLRELKRLFDSGLIAQEAYLEQQRKVLDSPN